VSDECGMRVVSYGMFSGESSSLVYVQNGITADTVLKDFCDSTAVTSSTRVSMGSL
jgi:hypothetical protein